MGEYFKREPTIEELSLNIKNLNKKKFYKVWKSKSEFEEELRQYARFIKSSI